MSKVVNYILFCLVLDVVGVRRLFLLLLASLLCVCVCADVTTDVDSLVREFEVGEVMVVAHRRQEVLVPQQRLDGVRLRELSVQSVADALRYFSGVQIKDYGGVGGLKTVDIRSMGSHHVGVFYDGVEVGNAQNGTVDLGKFSLENVESLSLYNGQKSELLQSAKDYGSAGSLYIRTRRPTFTGGKRYHLSASLKSGSFGQVSPSVLYDQRLTDRVHLSMNAEYGHATGRYRFRIRQYYPTGGIAWDTVGVRQNGDVELFRVEAGLFGYLPDGKWHVRGYYYQSERGIPRAIVRNVWTSSQRQWDRNAFAQGSFQYAVGGRWETLLSVKYANDKMRYLNPDTTLMYVDNTFLQQELYVSCANSIRVFDWWDIGLSGDYLYNTLDAAMVNFVYPRRHTGMVAGAMSFHYCWIKAQGSLLGTWVRDGYRSDGGVLSGVSNGKVSPSFSVSCQPLLDELWYVRAFYKQVFRMPTFNDLYYTDVGNISLRPEETRQYDVGMEYTKRLGVRSGVLEAMGIRTKVDGYFNQVKDKIVSIPKGNSQYRWMMMNLGYVEITGVDCNTGMDFDFSLRRSRYPLHLSIDGTYTYQRAIDKTDSSDAVTYGGQIAYIPRHSCSALVNMSWNGLSVNYSFIYVGERYHSSANIRANYERPWYTHDLAVHYQLVFRGRKAVDAKEVGRSRAGMDIGVEVNNLLNQQYEVINNYPMPGTNGKLIVKFMF